MYILVSGSSSSSSSGTPVQVFAGAGGTIVGAIDNLNTVFTLPTAPTSAGVLEVYLDGMFQRQGTDYTVAGAVITFTVAPNFGQFLDAFYFQ